MLKKLYLLILSTTLATAVFAKPTYKDVNITVTNNTGGDCTLAYIETSLTETKQLARNLNKAQQTKATFHNPWAWEDYKLKIEYYCQTGYYTFWSTKPRIDFKDYSGLTWILK